MHYVIKKAVISLIIINNFVILKNYLFVKV